MTIEVMVVDDSAVVRQVLSGVLNEAPDINVYATASLAAAMTSMAEAFENAEPNIRLVLNFAGSATLVEQIKQGAPADQRSGAR